MLDTKSQKMEKSQELALSQMRKSVEKLGGFAEVINFLSCPFGLYPFCARFLHGEVQVFDFMHLYWLQNYGDPTLMRFLIARSMDTDKAAKMFVQWQKWRDALVPSGFIPDSEIQDELGAKKIYLQGLSKKGFPIMVVKGSKHFPSKDQPQFKSNYPFLVLTFVLRV